MSAASSLQGLFAAITLIGYLAVLTTLVAGGVLVAKMLDFHLRIGDRIRTFTDPPPLPPQPTNPVVDRELRRANKHARRSHATPPRGRQ